VWGYGSIEVWKWAIGNGELAFDFVSLRETLPAFHDFIDTYSSFSLKRTVAGKYFTS